MQELLSKISQGSLSASEARELRPKLIEAILHGSDSLDEMLSSTNAHKAHAEIWSTLDPDDSAVLADGLLMLGRKSAPVAGVVRMAADTMVGIRALTLLGPRLWQTAQWYPAHGGFAL